MSQAPAISRAAVFLDRDGTVIEEKNYLSDPDGVVLLPTVAETISKLNSLGIAVVVATNQAGVARGYFAERQIALIHARLDELLAASGARIDRYEYCPHHPTEGVGQYRIECNCRKPKPGMLNRSASILGLDLARSLMVGDRIGDLEAGSSAGCQSALVRTGYGDSVAIEADRMPTRFSGAFDSVGDAVACWLNSLRS